MERKKAAALKYERGRDSAPRVVAKGEGNLAERIVSLAKESGVPIVKDERVVELLLKVDAGREIPPELYRAVAKIIAFICKITANSRESP
ncbi:EscU/YscU/HrcU family type III secretion system export apparatus switch protein [Thermovibrio sp.]